MTGPEDPAAAGRDRLRAGHADREQVIEALKNAFVQGRLTRDGAPLTLLVAYFAVLAALGFLMNGVATSVAQRRSRGQLRPRPGPDGHALDSERRGGTGHDPVPPGLGTGQTRADLQVGKSPQHRRHSPPRAGRARGSARPAPGAV
jgi:hypothetical protein